MEGHPESFPRLHRGHQGVSHHHAPMRLTRSALVARENQRLIDRVAGNWSRFKVPKRAPAPGSVSADLFAIINDDASVRGDAEPAEGGPCFDHLTGLMVEDAVARASATEARPLDPPIWIRLVGADEGFSRHCD